MTRREMLKNYVELCIRNEKAVAPYIELLGAELSIYDTITENQRVIGILLQINDDYIELIEEFSSLGEIYVTEDNGFTKVITDIEKFLDLLIEWEA